MNLDLHVWRFDWAGPPSAMGPGVGELAVRAEALGVRTLSFMDHYFQMDRVAPAVDPMLEGYTALGFVAGRTERLRLRLLVTGVTYRYPGLLAKIVTTLDVLSGGRAELGIGAGWYEREHVALGVPFPPVSERFERLEETLHICLQMWGANNGPYEGRHYRLAETLCSPAPVSQPRPRILIGGSGEKKTLRLVARYADACNIFGAADVVAQKVDVLRRHCDEIGRDPNEIEVTAMYRDLPAGATAAQVIEGAQRLAAVGVSSLVTSPVGDDPQARSNPLSARSWTSSRASAPPGCSPALPSQGDESRLAERWQALQRRRMPARIRRPLSSSQTCRCRIAHRAVPRGERRPGPAGGTAHGTRAGPDGQIEA